jgi:glycine/D-amino acid oxidase-like deaminating enzyme
MAGSIQSKPIVVVGAGICGVSTALWLQRYGCDVILIDKDAPGQAASYGNAGLIAQWAVAPTATPGLWHEAPRMLLDKDSALFAKWSYLPKMIPWLTQFLLNSQTVRANKIAQALPNLVVDAVDQHRALVAGTGVEDWINDSKLRYIYPTLRDFENDAYSWGLKRAAGFKPRVITGPEIQELEPIVGPKMTCMVELDGQGHIHNPGDYVARLAQVFTERGGRFIAAEVKDFERDGNKISKVHTTQGSFACSRVVITSGIGSKPLMARLGLSVPLEAERGYHVLFKRPSILPNHPMMAAGKFGITPMGDVLRCAGTVELGGTHLGPSSGPIALIRKFVRDAFPTLEYLSTEEWMGFRPSTPDSLPLIGEIDQSGIFTCFGHQHIGLTAGPKSGRMIADMISGRRVNYDMAAYDPNRFLR